MLTLLYCLGVLVFFLATMFVYPPFHRLVPAPGIFCHVIAPCRFWLAGYVLNELSRWITLALWLSVSGVLLSLILFGKRQSLHAWEQTKANWASVFWWRSAAHWVKQREHCSAKPAVNWWCRPIAVSAFESPRGGRPYCWLNGLFYRHRQSRTRQSIFAQAHSTGLHRLPPSPTDWLGHCMSVLVMGVWQRQCRIVHHAFRPWFPYL